MNRGVERFRRSFPGPGLSRGAAHRRHGQLPLEPRGKRGRRRRGAPENRRKRLRPVAAISGKSSLASYLSVIARRTCVNEMAHRAQAKDKSAGRSQRAHPGPCPPFETESGSETLEEVGKLLKKLPSRECAVVRLFYLEGRSYEEISTELNIPVNSIGAILAQRARNCAARINVYCPPVFPSRPVIGQTGRR